MLLKKVLQVPDYLKRGHLVLTWLHSERLLTPHQVGKEPMSEASMDVVDVLDPATFSSLYFLKGSKIRILSLFDQLSQLLLLL